MTQFNQEYWDKLFKKNKLGWDIGYPAPALTDYFDQLQNKNIRILVPGAGNGYEVGYLYENGFINVFMNDYSPKAVKSFKQKYPYFPDENIIKQDFFELRQKFDLIVELAFFTSFELQKRTDFVSQIYNSLNENGKYVGLFFTHEFNKDYPPFGATKTQYEQLFKEYFFFKTFEIANNSIKPRRNREYFFIMQKISH
ncbi:MAG: methyltransferase domain-containing protein [Bacteroidota bacterium]|nr:methyltransferase domain-containing protein [Bacteroidota bacterium]